MSNGFVQYIWCLHHPEKNILFKGLSYDELSSLASTLAIRNQWWVWKEGWTSWQSLESVEDFVVNERSVDLRPPPLVSMDMDLPEPQSEGPRIGIRKRRRFKKRFMIAVEKDGRQFRTASVNVSSGGVLLEDSLPSWVSGAVVLNLLKPETQEMVEILSEALPGEGESRRLRMKFLDFEDADLAEEFEYWLAS